MRTESSRRGSFRTACLQPALGFILLRACLFLYLCSLLNVEIGATTSLHEPQASALGTAVRLMLPALVLAAVFFLVFCLTVLQTMRRADDGQLPAASDATIWTNHRQHLRENTPRWALCAGRMGLLSLGLLGILITSYWPRFLVGGWVSLSLLAGCLAYVTYFWRDGPPTSYALQQRTLYNLRCYLLVLPCYLLAAETMRLWSPLELDWLVLAAVAGAFGWIHRGKPPKSCDDRQPASSSHRHTLPWTIASCGLLAMLSIYELDQPLSAINQAPFDFLLFSLAYFATRVQPMQRV